MHISPNMWRSADRCSINTTIFDTLIELRTLSSAHSFLYQSVTGPVFAWRLPKIACSHWETDPSLTLWARHPANLRWRTQRNPQWKSTGATPVVACMPLGHLPALPRASAARVRRQTAILMWCLHGRTACRTVRPCKHHISPQGNCLTQAPLAVWRGQNAVASGCRIRGAFGRLKLCIFTCRSDQMNVESRSGRASGKYEVVKQGRGLSDNLECKWQLEENAWNNTEHQILPKWPEK